MKKSKTILTTFYIVRHGQTEWNAKGLLQGHGDSPLTQEGEKQAREIGRKLNKVQFDEVFASDLTRAKRTAEIITLERKMAVKTTQTIRERNYGVFEGKIYEKYNKALQKLIKNYKSRIKQDQVFQELHGVEPTEKSVVRIITFLREAAVAYAGKTLLIVSHGGIMRYLLIHLGFGTHKTLPAGSIANTAFIILESDGVDFFVKATQGVNLQKVI